jgi:hypothetical protein
VLRFAILSGASGSPDRLLAPFGLRKPARHRALAAARLWIVIVAARKVEEIRD